MYVPDRMKWRWTTAVYLVVVAAVVVDVLIFRLFHLGPKMREEMHAPTRSTSQVDVGGSVVVWKRPLRVSVIPDAAMSESTSTCSSQGLKVVNARNSRLMECGVIGMDEWLGWICDLAGKIDGQVGMLCDPWCCMYVCMSIAETLDFRVIAGRMTELWFGVDFVG